MGVQTKSDINVEGLCKPDYQSIKEAFVANFDSHAEVGASLAVNIAGETVVDLWGGHCDEAQKKPWTENTISIIFSCTKAATALTAHLLIDRGELELDAPVAKYWPEYAKNGKENTTVRMMLNHSSAVPAFRETLDAGAYYNWEYMTKRLEEEAPFWVPGERNGYHMVSFGWTVGELVRRVSGQSLGDFFKQEIADPLGLDYWISLPESEFERVAPIIQFLPGPDTPPTDFTTALMNDPKSISHLSFFNSGGWDINSTETMVAEIGGAAALSNARGMVGMYVPLANDGHANGKQLLSTSAIQRMAEVSMATGCDATLLMPTRFGLGFMRSMDNRHRPQGQMESVVLGRGAFGHVGAGGSLGFADPDCHLAFAYTMNKMGSGLMLNERGQNLVDATYKALGFRDNKPGFWRL